MIDPDFFTLQADLVNGLELCEILIDDFGSAVERFESDASTPGDARAVVRCFRSLIDGVTASMRTAAIGFSRAFDKPLNPYLTEKSGDRDTSTYHRIFTSYRLIANFLPKSPLARIDDARWSDLRNALHIRNRIVHPESVKDLELTKADVQLVIKTGEAFFGDIAAFMHWFHQEEQRLFWEVPGTRRRIADKVGRNDPCPCGSERKYKNCCGRA